MRALLYSLIVNLVLLITVVKISKSEIVDEYLIKHVTYLLESSSTLKKNIDHTFKVAGTLDTESVISDFVKSYSTVKQLQDYLKRNKKDCGFEERTRSVILHLNLHAKIKTDLAVQCIQNLKTELENIDTALNEGLDNELQKCVESDFSCRIKNEFVETIKKTDGLVNSLSRTIYNNPLNEAKTRGPKLIQENIIEPVNECLLKLKNIYNDQYLQAKVQNVSSELETLKKKIDSFIFRFGVKFNTSSFRNSVEYSVMNDKNIKKISKHYQEGCNLDEFILVFKNFTLNSMFDIIQHDVQDNFIKYLEKKRKKLKEIRTVLEFHLEKELEVCIVPESVCRITQEFPETIKEGNEYLKNLNIIINNSPHRIATEILQSREGRALIYEKLFVPLNECILNSMFKKLEYSFVN